MEMREFSLANIAKIEVIPQETGVAMTMTDVFAEAECLAHLSEGEQNVLRVKNTIKAQNNTEDIVLGYDIKLVGSTVIPEILVLIDGGKWDEEKQEYSSPVIGKAVEKELFDIKIWTEDKDCNGGIKNYVVFEYKNCKGKPLNYNYVDGEFYIPEMNITSRPKCGESPVKFTIMKAEEKPEETE